MKQHTIASRFGHSRAEATFCSVSWKPRHMPVLATESASKRVEAKLKTPCQFLLTAQSLQKHILSMSKRLPRVIIAHAVDWCFSRSGSVVEHMLGIQKVQDSNPAIAS